MIKQLTNKYRSIVKVLRGADDKTIGIFLHNRSVLEQQYLMRKSKTTQELLEGSKLSFKIFLNTL